MSVMQMGNYNLRLLYITHLTQLPYHLAIQKSHSYGKADNKLGPLAIGSTLVFQLEEVCGINVVAHKMKNVSGGI